MNKFLNSVRRINVKKSLFLNLFYMAIRNKKNGTYKLVCVGIPSIGNKVNLDFFLNLKLRKSIWMKIGQEFLNIIKSNEKLWI